MKDQIQDQSKRAAPKTKAVTKDQLKKAVTKTTVERKTKAVTKDRRLNWEDRCHELDYELDYE